MAATQLYGNGAGGANGPLYARAALLQEDATGRPTLHDDLLTLAYKRMKRGDGELDLVLVAQDPAQALLLRLPTGLNLVGVVSERDLPPFVLPDDSPLAVVSGVIGAREAIAEGNLLIVDGERGTVLVEPEADAFVRLQAERGHRPRVRLGAAQLPAQTQAGRVVPVWAMVTNEAEVTQAQEAGADGLVLLPGGDLLPDTEDDPDAALPRLLRVADAMGGGDLTLLGGPDVLDPLVVVRSAPRARLRWALRPDDLPLPLSDLQAELDALVREETEEMRPAAIPALIACVESTQGASAADGWEALFLQASAIAALTVADTFTLPPLYVGINDPALLPDAVTLAAALVVSVERIAEAKDLVRAQEY